MDFQSPKSTQYQANQQQFNNTGITFKANQVLHKIAQRKCYPYTLLLQIAKLFHMNQFQIIFFSHILNDEECKYKEEPVIFQAQLPIPEMADLYNKITNNGQKLIRCKPVGHINHENKEEDSCSEYEQDHNRDGDDMKLSTIGVTLPGRSEFWTFQEMKKLYKYLLVIGYSIKYYLNEQTKAYEEEMKCRYPDFFSLIFNFWVDKYSNKVLRTNPRKINMFFMQLFLTEDQPLVENTQADCQYRNYNQIVYELLKATVDAEDPKQSEDIKEKQQLKNEDLML